MALINPSTLYSGGQGIFDTTPYRVAIQKVQAQKAAQNEALNKYFNELPKTLNTAGLLPEDHQMVDRRMNEIKKVGIQNSAAISKGGAARFNFDQMVGDLRNDVYEAQTKGKGHSVLGGLRIKGDMEHVFNDPTIKETIAASRLPVDDPNYKALDLTTLTVPPKPFDEVRNQKELSLSGFKPSLKEKRVPDPLNPEFDVVTTYGEFEKPIADELRKASLGKMYNNTSFAEFIKKQRQNPAIEANLKDVFKQTFGEEMQDDNDAAAAYDVSKIVQAQRKEKRVTNKLAEAAARNKEWDRRSKITFGRSMEKINANKAAGINEGTSYLSDEVAAEVGQDMDLTFGGKTTRRRVIFTNDVDKDRLGLIIGRDVTKGQSGVAPIPIKIKQPDGTFIVKEGYYQDLFTGDWEGDNGQKISRERVKDAYINKYAPSKFKAAQGTGGSENTKSNQSTPAAAPKPQGKSTEPFFKMN
jgi:hypothetical protein